MSNGIDLIDHLEMIFPFDKNGGAITFRHGLAGVCNVVMPAQSANESVPAIPAHNTARHHVAHACAHQFQSPE